MAPNRAKFARLIAGAINAMAAFEGKSTRAIAQDLGDRIQRSYSAIENYKSQKAIPTDSHQVRVLASIFVERAYLNEAWLREFLISADYPDTERLLAELVGRSGPTRRPLTSTTVDWRDNLEASPYTRFVMRHEPLVNLADRLRAQHMVALVGLGGMGKTSLAYQLALRCKEHATGAIISTQRMPAAPPDVDAVIWISDKDHPGETTLNSILETVVLTLGYAGLSAAGASSLQLAVEQLLRTRKALLICDNFDSITDPQVLRWLMRLPLPTRVLITSRVRHDAFVTGSIQLVDLGGMNEAEATRLIQDRVLQLDLHHVTTPDQLRDLYALTGGSPLAIRQILGYLKRTEQPLTEGLAALQAIEGDLLTELFAQTWAQLPPPARLLLLAFTLFQRGGTRSAAQQVAALDENALDQAISALTDYALIEREPTPPSGAPAPRYRLHSLTRRFISTHVIAKDAFPAELHPRWLDWAVAHANQFGYLLKDIAQLSTLDVDEPTLFAALEWAVAHGHDRAAITLALGLEFYYYVQGWWSRKLDLHRHYITAAARDGDPTTLVNALTMHIQLLCRLNRPQEAKSFLAQLTTVPGIAQIRGAPAFHHYHAHALYALAINDVAAAQAAWEHIRAHSVVWGLPNHMEIGTTYWLGMVAIRQGQPAQAQQQFTLALELAQAAGYDRWIARAQIQLARLARTQSDLRDLQVRLEVAAAHTEPTDQEQLAHLYREQAWLASLRGDTFKAQEIYQTARELFIRMGLDHEISADDDQALITLDWGDET